MAKTTVPSAANQTIGGTLKAFVPPSATHLAQAAQLFEKISDVASRMDRECFFSLGEIDDSGQRPEVVAERAVLALEQLRDAICRMGWMADLGSQKLTGHTQVRGDAECWLLWPSYPVDSATGAANG